MFSVSFGTFVTKQTSKGTFAAPWHTVSLILPTLSRLPTACNEAESIP